MSVGNGATIQHNRRAVQPAHGHNGTGHIFITTRNGNQSVIVLCPGIGFNTVSNYIPADEAVTHTVCAHTDTIAHADGVKTQTK